MKVKNEIKGLARQYDLEAVRIITPTKVLFSGDFSKWVETEVDMIAFKREVENLEVYDRIIFNNREAFIFTPDIGVYCPAIKQRRIEK